MIKIAPSILSADFADLGADVRAAEAGGADYIHVDVMDGRFVPNITIGPLVVAAVRRVTSLPLDVHLMIEAPERYLADFAQAGANILTVHVETCPHLHRTMQQIRELGVKPGVTLNPATSLESVREILPYVDQVLVMTVNPGFGGQSYIATMTEKIAWLAEMIAGGGFSAEIEVDGGIDAYTTPEVVSAGARVLVAGAAVFGHPQGIAAGIAALRQVVPRVH
ncbi:MAG: ribulose-phosphate 3-epimerase [Chloroflexi bacterium HGW-Chloroflexi-1]|nr:MAG: ribulose-phosphate 3-epimerase [Chloroflexi bacterium HGW-Chloroflexi-1]